jgi:hypothetical protein
MQNARVGPIVNIAGSDTLYMFGPFGRITQCIGFCCSDERTLSVYGSGSERMILPAQIHCICLDRSGELHSVLVSAVLTNAPHLCMGRGRKLLSHPFIHWVGVGPMYTASRGIYSYSSNLPLYRMF